MIMDPAAGLRLLRLTGLAVEVDGAGC